jgi:hypothetical protein
MAKTDKTTTITPRPNRVMDQLIKSNVSRAQKDIKAWRTALQQAENVETPRRGLLYNLYDELIIDAHLSAEIDKRRDSFLESDFNLIDIDGKINAEATLLLKKQWLKDLMEHSWMSKAWGHSLVEVSTLDQLGMIAQVTLINRRHVIPERGLVVKKVTDEKGILYREDPSITLWVEVGKSDDLGFLNKVAPHILYKRFAQGAWAEFCEIFGMPVRYAKTNTNDTASLNRLNQCLADMATASYAVINKEEELFFIETSKSDGAVYKGLMDYCSQEVSKLINGAVIGENSQGGSRSKEEVGLELHRMKQRADHRWWEAIMNEQIIPKLIALGYPFQGLSFEFEKSKDIVGHWKMVNEMLTTYDIDPEYIQETFNVPVKVRAAPVADPKIKPKAQHDIFFE